MIRTVPAIACVIDAAGCPMSLMGSQLSRRRGRLSQTTPVLRRQFGLVSICVPLAQLLKVTHKK